MTPDMIGRGRCPCSHPCGGGGGGGGKKGLWCMRKVKNKTEIFMEVWNSSVAMFQWSQ